MSNWNPFRSPSAQQEPSGRKRSFWRGIVACYVTIALVIVGFGIPFVILLKTSPWFFKILESPVEGPVLPYTRHWIFVQAIGFAGWLVSGIVAAHWSKKGSWLVPIVASVVGILGFILSPPTLYPAAAMTWSLLCGPAAIFLGFYIYVRRAKPNQSFQGTHRDEAASRP